MIDNIRLRNTIVSLLKALLSSGLKWNLLSLCVNSLNGFVSEAYKGINLERERVIQKKTSYFCLRLGGWALMDPLYFLRCWFETTPAELATIKGDPCLAKYTLGFNEGYFIIFRFLKEPLQCFIVFLPIRCSNQDVISLIEASGNVTEDSAHCLGKQVLRCFCTKYQPLRLKITPCCTESCNRPRLRV